jgi:hypothetical protein
MTVRGLWLALALFGSAPTEAAAHCYSRWHYPRPQRCQVEGRVAREMARWPQAPSRRVAQITPTVGEQAILPSSPPLLRRHNPERGHNPTKFREVLSPLAISNQEHAANKLGILLPSLASADLDGGEADEPTRAKVLLRAAMEALDAH